MDNAPDTPTAETPAPTPERKRILIIDDEASFARMVKLNLEKTGAFEVRVESKPAYALPTARDFKPDLILLDVIMPTMDGGDVANQIKRDRNLKDTPIIFLTATVSQREAGAPTRLAVTHPANWGPYKHDRLSDALHERLLPFRGLPRPDPDAQEYRRYRPGTGTRGRCAGG